jgi:hypothetical protein
LAVQTLKLSVSLPDDTHADMQLRLSANDADCDVLISLPLRARSAPAAVAEARSGNAVTAADDDYVLGGYAGI